MPRWLKKLRMPPDTFERHQLVARACGAPASLLDVGGNRGELALFMPDTEVVTVNIDSEDADVHFDGDRLPFEDSSFDAVVSVDVLEHIPAEHRRRHIEELVRVSRDRVIVCCPLGTPEHVAAERELSDWYRQATGRDHRFLVEHLERGLPTEEELARLLDCGTSGSLAFHGDFRRANRAFKLSASLRAKPSPRRAISYLGQRLNPRRDLALSPVPSPFTNRAFLQMKARGSSEVRR